MTDPQNHPEFDTQPEPEFHIPTITFIDPNYIKQRYMLTLTELENVFGELRNGDDDRRLEIVEELLSQFSSPDED